MLKLYFDGFVKTNPDNEGNYGVIIYKDNEVIKTISDNFSGGIVSNNVAEYKALLNGKFYY